MADFLTKLALIGAAVSFAACLVAANRRRIALVHDAARRILSRSAVESALLTVFVLGFVQYAATKGTNGNDRAENGTAGCKSADGELHVRDIAGETTNLCFTTIYASTNSVFLSLAWPTNLFADGACLDFFAKARSLTNRWEWIGCHMVAAGETNLEVEVSCQQFAPSSTNMPAAAFFLVADRETSATTMGDADGDGIPDVYELHNGTNPYVPDSEDVDRLTVGADCDYPTVSAALAASTNYSVVALSAGEHVLSGSLVMPGHPVMLTGPEVGYAVLHSDADIGAVMLVDGQDEKTLFRNLYVVLEARRNFQAGFWVGGNLPWSGVGASPTFENVRVRAPHPGVLYYGWHYYRDDGGRSLLTDCTMNAAGAENAIGVYSKGGPVVEMEGCHFTNFMQTNGNFATYFDEGVFSPTNVVSEWAGSSPGLSWAGYPTNGCYSATADSDGDGISDHDEIFVYDTDLWLADSDGDGVSDGAEAADGTDPRVFGSFLRHVAVIVTADDSLANVTNYVAWGVEAQGWSTNDVEALCCSPATNEFVVANSNATVYVKAYRDMNRNGAYDPSGDILLSQAISESTTPSVRFAFGDVDGDGFPDALELEEGSDPYNAGNYCFNLTLVEDGIARTTNDLAVAVMFGSQPVFGPALTTNGTFEAGIGHLVATNGESVTVSLWDDANANGIRDAWEYGVSHAVAVNGHSNFVTNTLPADMFDHDRDDIPDWWEMAHADSGLSPNARSDARMDPDGDGLINLHEYWADCDPTMPDGSNTLLSVCARSVDDGIRDVVPSNAVCRFVDYFANGSNGVFVANTNFWARNLDLSCVSVWNSSGNPETKTATAITRRHVVMANHWHVGNGGTYTFCDTNGAVIVRTVTASRPISDDLLLGRLSEPLPDTIKLPKVLPAGYANYIGNGRYLPGLCVNQEKAATVLEIADLDCEVTDIGGHQHSNYASTFPDNYVSLGRHGIRAATLGGNSGSPVFLVVGDELIFLFSKHLGSLDEPTWCYFYGPMITHHLSTIQNRINVWEGDEADLYQVQMLDMSVFDELVNQ